MDRHLMPDHGDVIVADPFFALVGVRSDSSSWIVDFRVAVRENVFTDLPKSISLIVWST